jgi:hypothetical protein
MLGFSLVPVLLALGMLPASVGQSVCKKEQEFQSAKEMLKKLNHPRNEKWVEAYQKVDVVVREKKNEVWADGWDAQKDMMTWPDTLEGWRAKYPYFGDDIDPYDLDRFPTEYDRQLSDVWRAANPLALDGKSGCVQFLGGFASLTKLDVKFKNLLPTKEDIWLAQEDLWVKRELLRIVGDANDAAGHFTELAGAGGARGQPAAKDSHRKRYRSPFWEIDLALTRNGRGRWAMRGTLKNITQHRLPLGMEFWILLEPDKGKGAQAPSSTAWFVDGEPLGPGQSTPLPMLELQESLTVAGLFGIEQIMTWLTAPIKRVDQLSVDASSSRTADQELVGPSWLSRPPATAMTKNGLGILRYVDVTPQVRHMPVGMAVIMDEDQIPLFLAAFANSKLRMQTLQCHWRHTREKIQGPVEEASDDPVLRKLAQQGKAELREGPTNIYGKGLGRTAPRATGGKGGQGRRPPPNTGAPSRPAATQEEEMSLVELAAYGVASLYERYPPRTAAAGKQADVEPQPPALGSSQ